MERIREYRPAMAAFVLMMAMALTTTALSFFVGPVCEELGVGRGSFTVYYSLLTATGTAAVPVLGGFLDKRGVRGVMAVSSVWVSAGLTAFSLSRSLWMFYAAAAFLGVFGTACVSLCAAVIVQRSYPAGKAAGLLGIVMSGSGVGGMIVSLVLPELIGKLGWRVGYRVLAVCWLSLGLVALALLGREREAEGRGPSRAEAGGMTRAQALGSRRLYLLILVIFLLSAACGIQQQLPSVLAGYGFSTAQAGTMISFFTAALALGKILQGLLCGRIGPEKGSYAVVAIFAVSFWLLRVPALVWPGLAALAFGMGSVTAVMPAVTRAAFGSRDYAAIWGILSAASNAGALIATPLFGMAYDRAGSYGSAMTAAAAALATALAALVLSFRKR